MLLVTIIAPMVYASAHIQSRSDFVGVNSQDEIIIHCNETLEIPITLQNIRDYTQTYTLELLSIGDDLSVSGLPLQYTLDPNRLRQVKFSIIGDSNAVYASSTLKLNITNDIFSDEYHNI